MKNILKKWLSLCDLIGEKVNPVIWLFIAIFIVLSIPFSIKSCIQKPNYENTIATFIGEEAKLHNEDYVITVLNAITVDKIAIKKDKDEQEFEEIQGKYIAVTVSIRQSPNCKKKHSLDRNDFKLKDHTGTNIPTSDIMSLINLDFLDVNVHSGDSVNSNASFETTTAVKDYAWVGSEIPTGEDMIITVYFKVDSDLSVETTIMIFEVDFYSGFGKNNSATDIVLFKRKEPIR